MLMKINFTAVNDADELQQLIYTQLIVGKTTVKDTQQFLSQQGLLYSKEIKQEEKYFDRVFKMQNGPKNLNFDSCLGCRIPITAKRINSWNPIALLRAFLASRLVSWDYAVRFYFDKGILTEITAEKVGTGF